MGSPGSQRIGDIWWDGGDLESCVNLIMIVIRFESVVNNCVTNKGFPEYKLLDKYASYVYDICNN